MYTPCPVPLSLRPDRPLSLDRLIRTCDVLQVPTCVNPLGAWVDRRTLARAESLGLLCGPTALARYHASRFFELTATAYPSASAALLQIFNDWHYWLWSFDDRSDICGNDLADDVTRHERVVAALLDLLADRPLTTSEAGDPNVRFLAEILRDLREVAPAGCFERFRGAVREYLVCGSLPGAQNWASEYTPDPETFLVQRSYEGAYNTILPFIELAADCAAADPVVCSAEAQRSALLANWIVCVSNDVFSFEKEVVMNGNPNNLLHVLAIHKRSELRGSYLHVVALVEAWTAELLALEGRAEGGLRRYLRGNFTWIAASHRWHFASGRYASVTSPFAELRCADSN